MVDDGVMRLEKNIRNNSMKSQRGKKRFKGKKKKRLSVTCGTIPRIKHSCNWSSRKKEESKCIEKKNVHNH